jgi:hypothetical protein
MTERSADWDWLKLLKLLKEQGPQPSEAVEKFRSSVLYDEDFCWAAVEGIDSAAVTALQGVTHRCFPDSSEIPPAVHSILGAVKVKVNW